MGLMDMIPTVNKCCFFLDLKIGSIIIAVIVILRGGYSAMAAFGGGFVCPSPSLLTLLRILMYVGYVAFVIAVIVIVTAILFLVGVFTNRPQFAKYFVYGLLLQLIIGLLMFVLTLVPGILGVMSGYCKFPILGIIMNGITFVVWFYFLMVIKSYYEE